MKRVVVGVLDAISSVAFVVFLVVSVVGGYLQGGAIGAIMGLILPVVIFGLLFIQLEMNENLRAIRQQLEARQS